MFEEFYEMYEFQAILDEYHKPVAIQDEVLGKLGLANNWLSQDEENPRVSETAPITEEEFSWRISMTSLTVTSDGSFTAYFDCDELFTDHAVTVYGSLKKGVKDACFRDMSGCELAEIEQAAGERCQPIGHIGYYYPAEVWISEYGKLYAKYEYQDEIECFPDVFALIERELRQCNFDSAAMKTVEALDGKL